MKLFCRRGDTANWTFVIEDGGAPRDITDDFIRFTVKRSRDDLDSDALIRLSSTTGGVTKLTQSGETLGQVFVEMTPVETAALPAGELQADVQLTFTDGRVMTPDGLDGTLTCSADVTRNSGSIATDT